MRKISDVNDDLMTLSTELEGLKVIISTIATSIDNSNVNETAEEKLHRLSLPYFTLESSLDAIIKKLDTYTNDLDDIEMHLDRDTEKVA